MTAAARQTAPKDLRKGWCPSLFEPMESGDGLIVRLKPHAATIDTDAARAIAEAAAHAGNGIVELTNRANLQLRGARPETVAPIAAMAVRLRLAAQDPAVERTRSVMASPLGPDDRDAAFDSHALAADIERMLGAEPALAGLPAKFGFLVDGGGRLPLAGVSTDIAVRPETDGLRVEIAGGDAAVECTLVDAVSIVRRLALAFLALRGSGPAPARRMRDLVGSVGGAGVFAEAGLSGSNAPAAERAAVDPVGYHPLSAMSGAFGIGLAFGQVDAPALTALAGLADALGDGTLRVTPWRALVVVGGDAGAASDLARRAGELGFITAAGDPRRAISACPGRPACGNATVDARADATALAARRVDAAEIHVSGCAKGCAHPGPAALTLVGANGRYGLVIGGSAGDPPTESGLSLEDALSAFNLLRRDR